MIQESYSSRDINIGVCVNNKYNFNKPLIFSDCHYLYANGHKPLQPILPTVYSPPSWVMLLKQSSNYTTLLLMYFTPVTQASWLCLEFTTIPLQAFLLFLCLLPCLVTLLAFPWPNYLKWNLSLTYILYCLSCSNFLQRTYNYHTIFYLFCVFAVWTPTPWNTSRTL